ncbi:MAG: cupin domain-containing protein [Anaerolineales bacterium]|jgi:quercetin dioxygenase-like cupin family protein
METNYNHIQDIVDQIPDVPPDSILSRTFHQDDHSRVVLFGFAPGQELSEHTASKPAILLFLKGEAELILGQDQLSAKTGTFVHMPAHLPHSIYANTSVIMLLILFEMAE